MTLVVADDNGTVRSLLAMFFEAYGSVSVLAWVSAGGDIVRVVEECDPDVLLLDLAMPGLDGLQVLEQLQPRERRLNVIVYSSFDERGRRAAEELGAFACLPKSVKPEVLIKTIIAAGQ